MLIFCLCSFFFTKQLGGLKKSKHVTRLPCVKPSVGFALPTEQVEKSRGPRGPVSRAAARLPSHPSPPSLFIALQLGQLASVPRSPVTAFARMFSPVVFPWTILSPQGGLISRLKKLPKALSAGYVLYSFRNCPLYLLAHFPHARCKCSEGGSLACPAPRGTRACDPQQPLSRPCWENAPVASGF